MRLETPAQAKRAAKHWRDDRKYHPVMFVSRRLYCTLQARGFDMRNYRINPPIVPLSMIIADDLEGDEPLDPEMREKVAGYYGKLFGAKTTK